MARPAVSALGAIDDYLIPHLRPLHPSPAEAHNQHFSQSLSMSMS